MQSFRIISIIPVITLLVSCGSGTGSRETASSKFCIPDSVFRSMSFDTVHSGNVTAELALSGRIACNEDRIVRIFPMVSGHVTAVKASLGDYIEKGKVLAVIESSEMASYFDEYKSAGLDLEIAKKNLEVTESMHSGGVTSDKDLLVSRSGYREAVARLSKAREILRIYGKNLAAGDSTGSKYVIQAPISGFILSKNITEGMELRADASDFLFTMGDLSDVWVTGSVYEADIAKVKAGSPAEITTISYPDIKFHGKVDRISDVLDPDQKLMNIRIRLKNPDFSLKPGMFAHIVLSFREERKLLVIKTRSVIFDENRSFLVSYKGKCDVSLREIKILKTYRDQSFFEADSVGDGDLAITGNGLFIYTALKSL